MTDLTERFDKTAKSPGQTPDKKPTPFSLRLTFEERAELERQAGGMPLGAFIRAKLLDEATHTPRQARRKPVGDQKALGQVLGQLGQSRLSSNLNQLARATNTGSLPVTPETEKAIADACADIRDMRDILLIALGMEP